MTSSKKIFALISVIFLSSCVETVVVGTLSTGVAITQEKKFSDTTKDSLIESKLILELVKNGLKTPGNTVEITVNEGRVLLMGVIRDRNKIGLANDLAWKISGVKEVIDETQTAEYDGLRPRDFSNGVTDYLITLQVESRLLFAKDLSSVNYKITTVNRVVYLIGIAFDEPELRRALTTAAKVRGVKKIVNHIILADDSRRQ
jgi:osmotically-inducible protein OsmY